MRAFEFLILMPAFLLAVMIHEISHGFVAYKLGDPTAKNLGRLSLNPLRHIDLFGSIIFPLVLILINSPAVFGWAKPVPINFLNLRNKRRDTILVSMAGCLSNFILAVILACIVRMNLLNPYLQGFLIQFVILNLMLGIFNFIPIPPLDGSRIVLALLPAGLMRLYFSIERYGIIIIFILLYVGFFDKIIFPLVGFLLKILIGSAFLV